MIASKEKIQELLPHIIGLLFIIILPLFLFDQSEARIKFWTYRYYYQLIFTIIGFYGNYLIIVPRYFLSKKRIRFFIVLFMFAVSLITVSQIISRQLAFHRPPIERNRDISSNPENVERRLRPFGMNPRLFDDVLFLVLVLGFSTGMRVLQRSRKEEQQQKEMEKVHVETELAFLKNQINPHFFFNALNNIYALIAIDSEAAQKAIEKLSSLMRYLIYESDVKKVKLQKEFEFTQNYIDLMKQRLTSKVKLTIDIQPDIPDIEIPPLIFIPFIENAFKHGVSYRDESYISISLRVSDKIYFSCKNSIPQTNKKGAENNGGMGIVNIKKRLDLLYGNDAQLIYHAKDNSFIVELTLPTEKKL